MNRVLDVSGPVTSLAVRLEQLVLRLEGGEEISTPLADLGTLVISSSRVLMSQAVVAGVAERGGSLVVCDSKHMPVAMMLPLQSHVTQTERFALQAAMPLPFRKRMWAQIVRAKIAAQARLLADLHGDDGGLTALAVHVRSGDPQGFEARAAQRYWPRLFQDPRFRRGREGPDQNAHLNYGYAVLRAMTARALCGAGLHPSLGLQHHNRYDPFCLANDLMEPFRPIVDRAVYSWVGEHDPSLPLDKEAKMALIGPLLGNFAWRGESRSLFDWLARAASSLVGALTRKNQSLEIAEL